MNTKLNLIAIWKQNQHLNYGEIRHCVRVAEEVLRSAIVRETQRKIAKSK